MKHLWEVNHPYYCNEGNYFSSGCHAHYPRWQDFIAEQGNDDLDLNLVFRFDWEVPHQDGDEDKPIVWQGDEYYRDSTLKLFYMGQRKGLYRWVSVEVCRADEPAIREWLTKRWEHMKKLWEPLSDEGKNGE
jgi:hypothetical protein